MRLFILDLRIRLKGLRPSPSPPTMPLKFKPGEETSVIEGLRAEVPGIPPSPPLLAQRKNLGRAIWLRKNVESVILAAENLGRTISAVGNLGGHYSGAEKTMRMCTFRKLDAHTVYS